MTETWPVLACRVGTPRIFYVILHVHPHILGAKSQWRQPPGCLTQVEAMTEAWAVLAQAGLGHSPRTAAVAHRPQYWPGESTLLAGLFFLFFNLFLSFSSSIFPHIPPFHSVSMPAAELRMGKLGADGWPALVQGEAGPVKLSNLCCPIQILDSVCIFFICILMVYVGMDANSQWSHFLAGQTVKPVLPNLDSLDSVSMCTLICCLYGWVHTHSGQTVKPALLYPDSLDYVS